MLTSHFRFFSHLSTTVNSVPAVRAVLQPSTVHGCSSQEAPTRARLPTWGLQYCTAWRECPSIHSTCLHCMASVQGHQRRRVHRFAYFTTVYKDKSVHSIWHSLGLILPSAKYMYFAASIVFWLKDFCRTWFFLKPDDRCLEVLTIKSSIHLSVNAYHSSNWLY